jgi:hypothetical protein
MNFNDLYPYKFDWGHTTSEAYNSNTNEVTFIFNFDLRSESKIGNAIQYIIGRICWGAIHFPSETVIRMIYDIRGQEMIISRSTKFKENLLIKTNKLNIPNKIIVEFLR